LVTVSNEFGNSGNGETVERSMETSSNWITSGRDTGVIGGTRDRGVNTSNSGIARVNGANIVVVTVHRDVEWSVQASFNGVTARMDTKVSIVGTLGKSVGT